MQKREKMFPKYISHYFYLIIILFSFSLEQNDNKNYFFTMYPSHNNKTSYLIHSFTPYSEHLTIDLSAEDEANLLKRKPYQIMPIVLVQLYFTKRTI